jgi:hypothetical protein
MKALAFGDRQRLRNIVDIRKSRSSEVDRTSANGSRRLAGAVISLRPRRSASLTRSFKSVLRSLRRRFNNAVTSSSIVKVVRIKT